MSSRSRVSKSNSLINSIENDESITPMAGTSTSDNSTGSAVITTESVVTDSHEPLADQVSPHTSIFSFMLKRNKSRCDNNSLLNSTQSYYQSSCFNCNKVHRQFDKKYESLDYEVCENKLYRNQTRFKSPLKFKLHEILRWIIILFIAILTALTASIIVVIIDIIAEFKHSLLKTRMEECHVQNCMYIPLLYWLGINGSLVLFGSLLVTYWAPVSAGSGIPLIKLYLNGVKVPSVVRIKTFITKAFGVITSVAGGMACGKEGPMIHCGSVIAAGISQGKSTTFNRDLNIFKQFREDREKRDFVSAGAASGVAAAFGAPVGALLFSLEEGASFWNQSLTWKIFFCSTMTTFSLHSFMSWYYGLPGQLSHSSLLNLGPFDGVDNEYRLYDLPMYLLIGVTGGLFGALYNSLNLHLTKYRMKYVNYKWLRVIEAVTAALFTASIGFILITFSTDCQANRQNVKNATFVKLHCPPGKHSVMADLWFNTPEVIVKKLFTESDINAWNEYTLSTFFIVYFIISCATYGLSISGGVFIPCLLLGASGGRLMSIAARALLPNAHISPGKFALIGAASMLGGVVRMTISLTVILIEATGNITFGLPIMLSIIVSKWVGDLFTHGLYDIHIALNQVPLLPWEPPKNPPGNEIFAPDVMATNVTCFNDKEKLGTIYNALKETSFNGFPVVDTPAHFNDDKYVSSGRLVGTILRWQLIVLIENRHRLNDLELEDFRTAYPRYPDVKKLSVPSEDCGIIIDLTPFMNPSPYTVCVTSSLARIFYLFRALGLRHLVVVNENNLVQGIVTRKDLAKFKCD